MPGVRSKGFTPALASTTVATPPERWVQDRVAADAGLNGEVEVLERLAGGEAGGRDAGLAARGCRGCRSRLSTARRRSACSSTVRRARSASLGSARAAVGAWRARNRCASSVSGRLMRSTGHSGQRSELNGGSSSAWRLACSARACASAVIVRWRAKLRACRQASWPLSSATASTSRSLTRLDAATDECRIERVVARVKAQVRKVPLAAPALRVANDCDGRWRSDWELARPCGACRWVHQPRCASRS